MKVFYFAHIKNVHTLNAHINNVRLLINSNPVKLGLIKLFYDLLTLNYKRRKFSKNTEGG